MNNEKKYLTSRDLALFLGCAVETPHGRGRLYRVEDCESCGVILDGRETDYFRDVKCADVRPVLRPLSDMTKSEKTDVLKSIRQLDIEHKMEHGSFFLPQEIREKIAAILLGCE